MPAGARDFRRLLGAQFVAQAGDGFVQAVVADVLLLDPLEQRTPGRILALTVLTLLPYSALSPFLGVFVDRWERRAIMVWTNVARAVVLVALPLWGRALSGDAELYVAVLALLGFGRLFLTTKGAALPVLVHERGLLRANAVSGGGGMVSAVSGGGAGVAAAAVVSTTAAFALAACAYLASAAIAARIGTRMRHPGARTEQLRAAYVRVARELADGTAVIARRAHAALPLAGIFVLRTAGMLVVFAAILAIKQEFPGAGDDAARLGAAGVALAASGAGLFLGVVAAPVAGRSLPNARLILLGFAISGAGIVVLGGIVSVPAIVVLTFVGSFGGALAKVAVDAQVQEALPDEYRGRAFALYDILYNAASVAAAVVLVAAQDASLRVVLPTGGLVTLLLAGALGAAMARAGMLRRAPA
ncbi:MAG TPA: MFS transporter [Actinomycetota bacterium]|nr:MFS transporter [Actinomycetota bacterium]